MFDFNILSIIAGIPGLLIAMVIGCACIAAVVLWKYCRRRKQQAE